MYALMIVKWLKQPSTGLRNRARATRPSSAHSESFGVGTYKGVQTMSFLLEGVRVEQNCAMVRLGNKELVLRTRVMAETSTFQR